MEANKNPTNEIFFFAHNSSKLCYVFMSFETDRKFFYKQFPNTTQITEQQCDDFVLKQNYEVVYIGDSDIIDDNFNTPELKKANDKAVKEYLAKKRN